MNSNIPVPPSLRKRINAANRAVPKDNSKKACLKKLGRLSGIETWTNFVSGLLYQVHPPALKTAVQQLYNTNNITLRVLQALVKCMHLALWKLQKWAIFIPVGAALELAFDGNVGDRLTTNGMERAFECLWRGQAEYLHFQNEVDEEYDAFRQWALQRDPFLNLPMTKPTPIGDPEGWCKYQKILAEEEREREREFPPFLNGPGAVTTANGGWESASLRGEPFGGWRPGDYGGGGDGYGNGRDDGQGYYDDGEEGNEDGYCDDYDAGDDGCLPTPMGFGRRSRYD